MKRRVPEHLVDSGPPHQDCDRGARRPSTSAMLPLQKTCRPRKNTVVTVYSASCSGTQPPTNPCTSSDRAASGPTPSPDRQVCPKRTQAVDRARGLPQGPSTKTTLPTHPNLTAKTHLNHSLAKTPPQPHSNHIQPTCSGVQSAVPQRSGRPRLSKPQGSRHSKEERQGREGGGEAQGATHGVKKASVAGATQIPAALVLVP